MQSRTLAQDIKTAIADAYADADAIGREVSEAFVARVVQLLTDADERNVDIWEAAGADVAADLGARLADPLMRRAEEWYQSVSAGWVAAHAQAYTEIVLRPMLAASHGASMAIGRAVSGASTDQVLIAAVEGIHARDWADAEVRRSQRG